MESEFNLNQIIDQILNSSGIEISEAELSDVRENIEKQLERAIWETVLLDLDEEQTTRLSSVFENKNNLDEFEEKISEIVAEVLGLSEKIHSRLAQEIDIITELLKDK